ncbi:hypothetical protein QO207_18075 [Pseudomonas sp. CAN2814]|uniref:glucosyltransferase domain-containing protein n=1 Tax=Pseudomonas sp. CAN1 TaxID=3046726 RepID=UPI00264840E0|nr:glucosyltransferase domain-containing protein [Pseudomonas sp. CAN1]MDN6858503.1 hypothetical protein [Pseudomonas sp. CAN1]
MYRKGKNDFALVFACTLLALLMSKGLALVPGMALDDYGALHQGRNPLFYLWQGRFVQAGIQVLLSSLGLTPTSIAWPVIILFFGFAALAITLGVLYVARDKGRASGLAAVGAVVASHPYLTEYFTYRESLITQGTSYVLLALVFVTAQCPRSESAPVEVGRWALLSVLMVLLAGTQQTVFLILGFFLIAGLVRQALGKQFSWQWLKVSDEGRFLLLYLLSAVGYVLIYLIIQKTTGVSLDSRSSIVGHEQWQERARAVLSLTHKLLLSHEPTLSWGVKCYAFSVFLILLAVSGLRRPRGILLIPLASLVFYLGSIFLVSISGGWWPVPRALYGLGFALGMSLLLVYLNSVGVLYRAFPVLTFIAAAGFSFHSSAMLHDQLRLNRWDAWAAGSIAQELLRSGGSESPVVLVGAPWMHPLGLSRIDGDLNISALSVPWAAGDLFMEATGRKWRVDSIAESAECDGVSPWPVAGSIRKVNDAFYVCMGTR